MIEFVAGSIRAASALSPRLGGDLAYRAFFSTAPRMRVRETDGVTHAGARRSTVRLDRVEVAVYEWGSGERTALLLHGWKGRASQFAPLVRRLVADGFRVVAFDAPAHGSSRGGRTDVRDWIAVSERLADSRGPFEVLVGHSFGALAALTLGRSSLPVPRVAVIAGAASPAAFVDAFVGDFQLDGASAARLRERFRRRLGVDEAELLRRYDAVREPLPGSTELLVVHDRGDRRLRDADSVRLHDAHVDRSRLLRTEGFGHSRILAADAVLEAVVAFARGGLPGVDAAKIAPGESGADVK